MLFLIKYLIRLFTDETIDTVYDLVKAERRKRKCRKKIKQLITEKDTNQFTTDAKAFETGLDIQDINNLTK
jgi:hypothetical protein